MPSRSLQTLAERLERRWRYVCEAEWTVIGQALGMYHKFVLDQKSLCFAIEKLTSSHPTIAQWFKEAMRRRNEAAEGQWHLSQAQSTSEPAARGWTILNWASGQTGPLVNLRGEFENMVKEGTSSHNLDAKQFFAWRRDYLIQTYLRPLHEYLLDALDSDVETLSALRWFQHWAQWFGASRFEWEKRLEEESVKAGKRKHNYEKRFQLVMFEKLFEYGLHLELSREPNTAAGSPDFLVTQRTSHGLRPIVVEAKILDKDSDPKTKLGHLQIRRYMDALHADTGYLVLFDLSERGHHVELPDRLDDLPFLPTGDGRQVFVIHAPIVAQESASTAKPSAIRPEHFQFTLG